eukprot:GILJ01001637.1.p1 GENE.GILJ01001637.1~~GILJ01001637.1.p1  ORF type:complete len:557 (+),score=97.30 GILJ01001637.1:50-1720(+)
MASSSRAASGQRVFVVGVGMTKFIRPGRDGNPDYPDMAKQAAKRALTDAGIPYSAVEQVAVGYVYGDSTCGQRAVYEVGLTGIPVYNVNNNCSTGSTALMMARQWVQGGLSQCVMALGFERMEKGSLGAKYTDRTQPMDKHINVMVDKYGFTQAPFAAQMFGNAGKEHMEKYGTTQEQFAKVAHKNHKHSGNNPYSQFRDYYSLEQIVKSPEVHFPLTKLQCCPTSDGAAAAVLCSEEFVVQHGLQDQAVEIIGQAMATDLPSSFEEKSCIKMVGFDMSKTAAQKVYQQTGLTPQDVQVIEVHDCFSCNELLTYEALGLCPPGQGGRLVDEGNVTYGGKWVVNPSGGLISKGHPLGATGLAQCAELCWQLRGMAEARQVPNAKVALQHNLGLGGAAVVTMYRKYNDRSGKVRPNQSSNPDELERFEQQTVTAAATSAGSQLKTESVLEQIKQVLTTKGAEIVSKTGAVYQIDISQAAGQPPRSFTIDLKNGTGSVSQGSAAKPDVTFLMSDEDFVNVTLGKLNPQVAFMQGKMKIKGNMKFATRFTPDLFAPASRL